MQARLSLLQEFFGWTQTWRHGIQMSDFGAGTAKPTWLYSLQEEIGQLDEFRCAEKCLTGVSLVKTYEKNGVKRTRRYEHADALGLQLNKAPPACVTSV